MQIRPDRQTLYWSATWPKEVEQLSKKFLYNPYKVTDTLSSSFSYRFSCQQKLSRLLLCHVQVIIGSSDLKANRAIRQIVDVISESQKYNKYVSFVLAICCLSFH